MINEFLTRLDNRSLSFDGIYRSSAALVTLPSLRQRVWGALFGSVNSSEHFRIACEILLALRNSVVAPWEVLSDARITYDDDDLAQVLLGKGSSVTGSTHPLSFLVTVDTPSKQTWTVRYLGGGSMESVDEDNVRRTVTGLIFSPTAWTPFDLARDQGKAQVLDEPPVNSTWTITRDVDYNSQLSAISERLSVVGDDEVIQTLPVDLIGLYRNTPVLRSVLQVAAAAAGVVYGP